MGWWNRTRKNDDEAPSPPPPPRPETDAEMMARFQREYAEKDRRAAQERVRQDKLDEAQQARRDAVQRELVLRVIARNGVYFPGELPEDVPRGIDGRPFGVPPAWVEYQAELDDVWRGEERRQYQAHQWDPQ